MGIEVPVFVPFRASEGTDRFENWERVRSIAWGTDFPVFMGKSPDGPFNISAARNDAASRVNWDLAIFADADSYVPRSQIIAGIQVAEKTRKMVIPHSRWVNIEPHEYSQFLFEGWVEHRKDRVIHNGTKSSVVIIPREVYDEVNGFDERFQGWGWEDTAFYHAVTHLYGSVVHFEGNVWHFDHERPNADVNRGTDPHAIANRNHFNRYKHARNETELRKLIIGNRVTI